LKGFSTLAQLLDEHGKKRNCLGQPSLTKRQILAWADAHHARTGEWPNVNSGPVVESPEERWNLIANALYMGLRGLPGGSSLHQLLVKRRAIRDPLHLPPLTEEQVANWARLHFQGTGCWPKHNSGSIAQAPGDTWSAVDHALHNGRRGLPGGSSLWQLLVNRGWMRDSLHPPLLTEKQILSWAAQCFEDNGRWPKLDSGPIPQAPGETWSAVDTALRRGKRGLSGGSSLAKLLAKAKQ
jgi:hypothetical protein